MAPLDGTLTIASVHHFAHELAGELADAAADALVGVYVHGSAVLGDWISGRSDVDLLVVVTDAPPTGVAERLAAVLAAERDCPGAGVEASVVAAGAASVPRAPWPFIVHVTTAPPDRKTVFGAGHAGDPDLILHYAVTRDAGWSAFGPRPETVVGAIPDRVVLTQLAAELRWAVTHADESYAVLNACRALRYRDEGVLCSKCDGGTWAISRGIEPALVQAALDGRRRGFVEAVTPHAAEWILTVAAMLQA